MIPIRLVDFTILNATLIPMTEGIPVYITLYIEGTCINERSLKRVPLEKKVKGQKQELAMTTKPASQTVSDLNEPARTIHLDPQTARIIQPTS